VSLATSGGVWLLTLIILTPPNLIGVSIHDAGFPRSNLTASSTICSFVPMPPDAASASDASFS